MKHLAATTRVFVLFPLLCFSHADKFTLFQQKICHVAGSTNAKINIIYRMQQEAEVLETSFSTHWTINEYENWNKFYGCLVKNPLVIRNMENFPKEPLRLSSSINIYFINSPWMMHRVEDFLNAQQHWKHDHHYVFIWLLDDISALRTFFEKVWQKNILNAVAAIINVQQIYTYEPFTENGLQLRVLTEQSYFYDKLRNFHQQELRISMFKDSIRAEPLQDFGKNGYKNIDGSVARTVVECLNATARYITPSDNYTYGGLVNGTFTGALKDIHSGLAQIGFNFRFTLDEVKPHFEELYPYKKRSLYLVVPAAEMAPISLIFITAYTTSLWLLLLLNFFLLILVFLGLQKLVVRLSYNYHNENLEKYWRWYEIAEMFVKAQLGQAVKRFARFSSLRQFLITWICFHYLLATFYFAKLESSFVQPKYDPELDNLKDLHKLKVPIYAVDVLLNAIKVSLNPKYYQVINNKSIRLPMSVTGDDFTLAHVKKLKNAAIILHEEMANALLAQTYNEGTKRPTLHIVKEYLRSFTCSYVVPKGSPFIYKFQKLMSSFVECGFVNHWLQSDFLQNNYFDNRTAEFREDFETDFDFIPSDESPTSAGATSNRKEKVALSLEILQGAFYLWFVGICISCLGFGIEHFYFYYQKRRIKLFVSKA